MMHDDEKSDLAIVAAKLVNNAGHSAAELVEPRLRNMQVRLQRERVGRSLHAGRTY